MADKTPSEVLREVSLMAGLGRSFYSRPTLDVARLLLGRTLIHESAEGTTAGRIVEVEAYVGASDPGSHAFKGKTPRNSVMFGPPGHLYVYFTYGMHYCSNVVCEKDGVAGAVLLRAVEPLEGIELMTARRGQAVLRDLARGPARLCQAFGIGREENGTDLLDGEIWIQGRQKLKAEPKRSGRIGMSSPEMDRPFRFYEPGPWTSGKPR